MKNLFTLLFFLVMGTGCMMANDDNGILRFDFENYKLNSGNKYYEWFEKNSDGTDNALWASGNAGFAITAGNTAATDYPTAPDADSYDNAGLKLMTKSTGTLGKIFKMPIAAGNIFIGTFDAGSATSNALKATKFGKPFIRKPLRFSGYYQYAAGAQLTDKSDNKVDGTDEGQVYAVFYANKDAEGKDVVLDGSNILTSDQIVAVADAGTIDNTDEWTRFAVDFDYGDKTVDPAVLANGGYSLAVVFTSSKRGAEFTGAVGSVLRVDKVVVEYEQTFTDNLVVKINEEKPVEQTSSIQVTKHEDGDYTLSLKNFYMEIEGQQVAVGNIVVDNVAATTENDVTLLNTTQDISISEGDDADEFWMGTILGQVPVNVQAKLKGDKLYAVITIQMQVNGMDMNILVTFGKDMTTGISGVTGNKAQPMAVYDLSGRRVTEQAKGQVYIIKHADGSTVKTVAK